MHPLPQSGGRTNERRSLWSEQDAGAALHARVEAMIARLKSLEHNA